jgi:hypothetical protein
MTVGSSQVLARGQSLDFLLVCGAAPDAPSNLEIVREVVRTVSTLVISQAARR